MHHDPARPPRVVVQLDPEKDRVQQLIQRWRALSAQRGRAKKEMSRIEAELSALLGNAEVGTLNGKPVVVRGDKERPRLDAARLRRDHPELAEEYRSPDDNGLKFPRQEQDRPS